MPRKLSGLVGLGHVAINIGMNGDDVGGEGSLPGQEAITLLPYLPRDGGKKLI